MERPERPSRHSKSHDKWKRIIQPAGDSDSSSDWSSDSDLRPDVRYFSTSEPASEASGSNRNTFECTSVNLQPSTSNAAFSLDLRSMFSLEKRKRPSENPDAPSTSNNSHLLHHDYAVGDSYKTSGVETYGWPWYVRPGSSRKRVRFSLPGEGQTRNETNLDSLDAPPPLSILTPRQITVASLSETLPVAADSKHGLLAEIGNTPDSPPMYPLLALRRRQLEISGMAWNRKYNEVMDELQSSSSSTAPRPDPEASEVQVISMAGPSTSGIHRAAASVGHSRLDPNEEVIIVEDQQQAEIPILEIKSSHPPAKVEVANEEESINQQLISLLECPVCMEYMRPPIQQCRRGHLLCSLCKPKLQACPTCRSRLSESRNLAMEKVADKLQYPCKNAAEGCTDQLRLSEKEFHESNCSHRSYRCCFAQCDWKGFYNDTLPHYKLNHSDKWLVGSEQTLRIQLGDMAMSANQNWIISTLGELFRVNFITVKSQPRATMFDTGTRLQIFGCVQFVGACSKAKNFRYKLESRKSDGGLLRSAIYKRTTHNDLKKCIGFYSTGDSFCIRGDTAELLSDRSQGEMSLLVHVKVQPSSEVTTIA